MEVREAFKRRTGEGGRERTTLRAPGMDAGSLRVRGGRGGGGGAAADALLR